MQAYISLGSNIGDGPALIHAAIEILDSCESVSVVRLSSLYRTAAWGRENQPDFTNAVAELESDLSPLDLLNTLLAVEEQMGRDRSTGHWGPRSIDLDLLLCGQHTIDTENLHLPHPRMHLRKFVLEPLVELDRQVHIPGVGAALDCLLKVADQQVEQKT